MDTTELLHSILAKDYVTASEKFDEMVHEKIDAKISDMKIALAQRVFNASNTTKSSSE